MKYFRVLLGAPRRSSAIPNASGTLAVYSQTTYSFESHSKTNEIRVFDIENGRSHLVTNDPGADNPQWLGETDQLIWLKGRPNGNTSFIIGNAREPGRTYTAGTVSGPISDLKLTEIEPGKIGFAVTGKANPDGTLFNPHDVKEPFSSGRLYTSLFVRHWDSYVDPQRNTIYYGLLRQAPLSSPSRQAGRYTISGLTNLIAVCGLHGVESPIPPFGGSTDFDISPSAIVFVARDPELNPAVHTSCICYYCPIFDWTATLVGVQAVRVKKLTNLLGAMSSPALTSDGSSIAVLSMKEDGYESDKNRLLYIPNPWTGEMYEVFESADGKGQWDLSPSAVSFAHDDRSFLLQAEEKGRVALYQLPLDNILSATPKSLKKLTHSGSVNDFVPAAKNSSKLFVSSTSFVDNSLWYIIDPQDSSDVHIVSSHSRDGTAFGLSSSQVDEIWFKGADNIPVHAWVVKPSDFKPGEKYPLAYLIHGGPQGAWNDQWSTRWNPAVFAEQGKSMLSIKEHRISY